MLSTASRILQIHAMIMMMLKWYVSLSLYLFGGGGKLYLVI